MIKVTCVLFGLLLAVLAQYPHHDPVSHAPLVYKVNIQDPPLVRWAPIIKDFQEPLTKFLHYVDLLPIPKTFFRDVDWYARNQFKYQDFVAEVDAIAKLSGFPFDKVFFINFLYEYSTVKACTGVLVRTDTGKIIHGRNLDFEMWGLLANLQTRIEYYKAGKLLFTVDQVIGSVFTLTAHKTGAFSVEVNTRFESRFQDDFISVLIKNAIPTCWLLKKVVEEQTTYEGALQRLKTQKLASPVYFVLSGTKGNQGAVIERDSESVHGLYELSDTNWFLVQTNYDRNKPDPKGDYRRIPAQNKLKERGNKGLNEQELFDLVLSQFPTLNIETISTSVMISSEGYHNTTIWYGKNPKSLSLITE